MSMLRAIASSDNRFPGGDYLAVKFLGRGPASTLAKIRRLRRLAAWVSEQVSPGAYLFEIARGRYMDQVMIEAVDAGARDVVVLGAGYDSRAYRFADRLPGVRFWEVDQPSMVAKKRAKLTRALGRVPKDVRYVEVDFELNDLMEAMQTAGLSGSSQTVWLWSGVSYYLSLEAANTVLALVRDTSSAGSSLVFDYAFRAFLDGDNDFYGASRARRYIRRQGEPWRFGIGPHEVRRFLDDRGLELVSSLSPDELVEHYLTDADGRPYGRPLGFVGLCHAHTV